jgi:hypothetical protein
MKEYPLLSFVLILLISITVLAVYSLTDYKLEVFGLDINKSGINKLFKPDDKIVTPDTIRIIDVVKDTVAIKQIDSTSQRILLAGDSMVEGLMHPFSDYCIENGHELFVLIWYSSSSKAFAQKNKLKEFIDRYKATYVILVLGANELFVRDIQNRDEYIKEIIRQSEDVTLIWVGPPNWKKDTGINDLILNNIGKDRYFPSKELTFDRISDGAHPTRKSSQMWGTKIAEWIVSDSKYPILLNKPEAEYRKKMNPLLMNYGK